MSNVWFITGAGSGIGAATARAALAAGNRVVATGRNTDKVRKALEDVAGDNLVVIELDVTDEAQAHKAASRAVDAFGRIDVLVNNAGYSLLGNFEDMRTSDIQEQMQTNFFGVVNVMRAVLPVMRTQRAGRIINISSVAGVIGIRHCAAYGAAKFAVEGLTFSVAEEVAQFGIKLTVVSPGFFRTNLLDAGNVRYVPNTLEDYASEPSAEAAYSAYDGQQTGNPAALGHVLVRLSHMDNPPMQFMAGADAVAAVTPFLKSRLEEIQTFTELSTESAGSF
ncbi:SDR family oxidoreductase [Rhizobium sp. CFBP 8762]|uniref:SDR family oxidoreductase n=1 Tax=Rhizobium sp. CFBP 8762 TaxID=2775279 RepID=UPI00178183F0|nr:SDR family oxidoreductase [Rhizobium sp. CFBP 8762]MBD8555266.1 SDR family oxidoreductase [Rhizobium sp. CFBP 8762]